MGMERRRFILSWGRKIFFGLGWPLLSVIGLNYLQSQIIPQTGSGIFYFLVTYLGHYGLLTSVLYFVLWVPVIYLFPYYYVSRLWAIFLLMSTSFLVFVDSMVFVQYRFHMNKFMLEMLTSGAYKAVFPLESMVYLILGAAFFLMAIYIWWRGDRLWRYMSGRFSNPVSHWYLILIIVCALLSHGMHIYADSHGAGMITRLTNLFPLHFPMTAKTALRKREWISKTAQAPTWKGSVFHYPSKKMNCLAEETPNLLVFAVPSMNPDDLNPEENPAIYHYLTHGLMFNNHHSGSSDIKGGLFSLIYGLPGFYESDALRSGQASVLLEELSRRHYKMGVFTDGPAPDFFKDIKPTALSDWKNWTNENVDSKFFQLVLPSGEDKINDIFKTQMNELFRLDLHHKTIVIFTSAIGPAAGNDLARLNVPLMVIWPKRGKLKIDHFTSHYDVMPTILKDSFECQNKFTEFSFGSSLFVDSKPEIFLSEIQRGYGIVDYVKDVVVTIQENGTYQVMDENVEVVALNKARKDVILQVLRDVTRFRK
jgi:membrane-anchored protein YejM (alkaline phosphatase superfamily)